MATMDQLFTFNFSAIVVFGKINTIFVLPFHIQKDFKIFDKTTVTFLTGIQIVLH